MGHFTEIVYIFQFLLKSGTKTGIFRQNLHELHASEGYVEAKTVSNQRKKWNKGRGARILLCVNIYWL